MKTFMLAVATSTMLFVETPDLHRTIEQHYTTTQSQSIELRGFSGSRIKVRSWDKDEVSVRLDISFSSSHPRDEQQFLDAIELRKTESNNLLRIQYHEPEMSTRSSRSFWTWLKTIFSDSFTQKEVEGEIFVPRSNPLSAEVRYGSIDMEGMKGSLVLQGTGNTVELRNCLALGEVTNDYGKVTIEHCGGNLRLSSKSTTILIDQFDGKVGIDANYSNITVRDVKQSLTIHSTSGTIKVDHIGGDAWIRSYYSNISASNIPGMLEIEGQSGKVAVNTVGGVRITAAYSPIEVSNVSGKASDKIAITGQSGTISLSDAVGDVRIGNQYGKTDLQNIRGNVDLHGSRIVADNITGDWQSESQYSPVTIRNLSSKKILVSNKSGKVDLSLKVSPSVVDITNEYADVNVEMPAGFSGDVDLNVSYGQIHTNLPLSKTKSFNGGGGYAMGKIGNGNGKLTIETKSGNVNLNQR
jgi:DUF4097 and DUF4098 domain-containing protein YvlB